LDLRDRSGTSAWQLAAWMLQQAGTSEARIAGFKAQFFTEPPSEPFDVEAYVDRVLADNLSAGRFGEGRLCRPDAGFLSFPQAKQLMHLRRLLERSEAEAAALAQLEALHNDAGGHLVVLCAKEAVGPYAQRQQTNGRPGHNPTPGFHGAFGDVPLALTGIRILEILKQVGLEHACRIRGENIFWCTVPHGPKDPVSGAWSLCTRAS